MTASNLSRRGVLGALAAGSVALTTPATAIGADPIFAMIASHKNLEAAWQGLYDQLQDAEIDAASEHGNRPGRLISWRDYTIGGSEIDTCRERLLEAGEVDPAGSPADLPASGIRGAPKRPTRGIASLKIQQIGQSQPPDLD